MNPPDPLTTDNPGLPLAKNQGTASPPVNFTPAGAGERKEAIVSAPEKAPLTEVAPVKETGPEVKDWLTKLETGEEIKLPQPVTDDNGQVMLDNATPQQVTVTLPLTEEEMNRALHVKIIYSLRWLAEWTKRLIKIVGGKFLYKPSNE